MSVPKLSVDDTLDELEETSLENLRHEDFCRYVAQSGIISESYQKAYPDSKRTTASTKGQLLMSRPEVGARVKEIRKLLWGPNIIEEMEILERLSRIVRADPALLFTDSGEPRPMSEIPEEVREAIEGLEHELVKNGEDFIPVRKVKLASKATAYNLLMRYYKLLGNDANVNVNLDMAAVMDRARERANKAGE